MKKQTLLTTTLATSAIAGLLTFASVANAGPNCGGKNKHGQKYSQMSDAEKTERMEKRLNRTLLIAKWFNLILTILF